MSRPLPGKAKCSCYGPGLWNNKTASGVVLTPTTVGVAHKTLPLNPPTRLKFLGKNGWVNANVIDRGPFKPDREFDLTEALVKQMGYSGYKEFGVRDVQWDYA